MLRVVVLELEQERERDVARQEPYARRTPRGLYHGACYEARLAGAMSIGTGGSDVVAG